MIYARGAFEVHALDGRRNDKVAARLILMN
jgi:hypothetical protein